LVKVLLLKKYISKEKDNKMDQRNKKKILIAFIFERGTKSQDQDQSKAVALTFLAARIVVQAFLSLILTGILCKYNQAEIEINQKLIKYCTVISTQTLLRVENMSSLRLT